MRQWAEAPGVRGQLSMGNDLHLIRSMCSACGNALYVVTAWKNRLVMDGGLVGGEGRGAISLCVTLMGKKNPQLGFVSSPGEGGS